MRRMPWRLMTLGWGWLVNTATGLLLLLLARLLPWLRLWRLLLLLLLGGRWITTRALPWWTGRVG